VHAHDWLVTHPAIALADFFAAPLVATIHATEAGRHSGWLSQSLNQQIHSVEWWLANRADALITCSSAMRAEVSHLFEVTDMAVIHNGIYPQGWRPTAASVRDARARYSPEDAPVVVYFGRLEWEKGVHDLLAALPRVRRAFPGTRLVVAGQGRQAAALVAQSRKLRVRRSVDFAGHLPDRALKALLVAADVVVLPSRYEPFGIVALEAAAAGAPLVASTAGGLAELVVDGETGLSVTPGDVDAIAGAVRTVLADPAAAARRARAAKARLAAEFSWQRIAEETVAVYESATVRDHQPLGRPKIASGNAFTT